MARLKGKVAVITGGASGMGEGTVELFVAEGAKVILADIKEAEGREIAARHGDAHVRFQRCDVTVEDDIKQTMQAAVDAFGGLDIVFNNAGAGGPMNSIKDMTGEAWDASHALLLRSVALGIRYAIPHLMARGGGTIVNTASVAGVQAGLGPTAYSVAKCGVIHLTKVAAMELARDNIRVNAICPGLILTNIFTPANMTTPQMAETIKNSMRQQAPDSQPIAKAGLPEDIANACLFLASDESAFVTGQHLIVDGGMTLGPKDSWHPDALAARAEMVAQRRAAFLASLPDNPG